MSIAKQKTLGDWTRSLVWVLACALLVGGSGIGVSPADDANRARIDRAAPREWNVSGNRMTGRFSGLIRDEALINVSGRVQRIKLSTLSEADLLWLWELHQQEGRLEQLPIEYRERPGEATASSADEMPANGISELASDAAPSLDASGLPEAENDPAANDSATLYDPEHFRNWSNREEPIHAKFDRFWGRDQVNLFDGRRFHQVPFDDLSLSDLNWLRGYHAHHGIEGNLPERLRPRDPSRPAATASSGQLTDDRTWTDREGRTTQGRFFHVRDEQVSIVQMRGGPVSVHLAQLSRADLVWLQDRLQEQGRLTELPLVYRDPPDAGKTDSQLARDRRQGGVRQWRLFNGQTFVAAYQHVREGVVHLRENNGTIREENWNDLSRDDHAYLRSRLAREVPGEFFPAAAAELNAEQQTAGMRIWTDREGNELVGKFVNLTSGNTVAVLDTPHGPFRAIYEYLSPDDQEVIRGISRQNQQTQVAQGGTGRGPAGGYTSNPPTGIGTRPGMSGPGSAGIPPHLGGPPTLPSTGPGSFSNTPPATTHHPSFSDSLGAGSEHSGKPLPGRSSSGAGTGPDHSFDPGSSFPTGPTLNPPSIPTGPGHIPGAPIFEMVFRCDKCGAEFDSSSGLKVGDACPKCSRRAVPRQLIFGGILAASVIGWVIRKVSR